MIEYFDSHAHYNDDKFNEDREELLNKIYEDGITSIISAGYSIKGSRHAIEIANKHEYIYATAGISPNDVSENIDTVEYEIKEIEDMAKDKKVIAIGEIGLDYYWNKENKEIQKQYFIKQIELANKLDLPIVIHTRDAWQDTIEILKENKVNRLGVFHCCPLNQELVKEALKLNFYISFAGPITFKNTKNADEIIKMVPIEKIFIETDSPYLSPEPNRGKRNDSRNVKYVAKKISEVKQISEEEAAKITYDNVKRLYKI